MKITKLISFLSGCMAIVLTCFTWYILRNFGDVNIGQIIFNMGMQTTGVDYHYIKSAFKFIALTLFLLCIWYSVIYHSKYIIALCILIWNKIICLKKKLLSLHNTDLYNGRCSVSLLCLFSMFMLTVSLFATAKKFHAFDLLENDISENSDFIKEHYNIPHSNNFKFQEKNNIVVILVESMENTFSSNSINKSYMPFLDNFREESQFNDNMLQTTGTGWTIAAFTGWAFGVPLKLPKFVNGNSYTSKRGFLPNAQSIFDVLLENGYELVMVMGSDSRFSGLDILLKGHGKFRILDKEYWIEKKWRLQDDQGTGWGFSDKFVLNRAIDEYKKLAKSGKPFALFVQTLDTHSPKGYCPPEKIQYNDIRDAIQETDLQLGKFISSYKSVAGKNDVLAIIGDHYFMGAMTFFDDSVYRTIYNAFHGNVGIISDVKKEQKITAMDIAPTLLHCAGAKWENNKFGIGVSLFSDDLSLVEQMGEDNFKQNLEKYSEFYTSFY